MDQTGSVRSEEPAKRLALIAAALTRRGVRFVAIGGWAAQVQEYDLGYETEDIDFTPQRELDNLNRLSAALKDLGARVRAGDENFAFDHNGESLGNASVWNLICEYGRFDLSFEPAAMGGYEGMIPTARKIFIDAEGARIEVLCADIKDIVRSKETANRPKDEKPVKLLRAQIEQRKAR